MALEPGTEFAHYRLIAKLGEGGMGAVWRARDTRLDRDVAAKFILPESVANPSRRARFEREAKLLAAVSHPNVGAIHGIEECDGAPVLILELVPGETLEERIGRGPVSVDGTLAVAAQLLDGLAAAHEAGIVHRDLKPANVRITPAGQVKILDFGLGKATAAVASSPSGASATVTAAGTIAGTVLGTPAYMSPEQTRGLPAGPASDLWAFACVVCEMLTGRQPFAGPTISDTIAAVLTREPDLEDLPQELPAPARDAVERCLEKDASRRPASARDLRSAFEVRVEAPLPELRLTQETLGEGVDGFPAWSPDGTELVYAAETGRVRKVVRMRRGSGRAEPLTRGGADDIMPAWSPDGSRVLFVRSRDAGRRLEPKDVFGEYQDADLWEVELATGRETRLAEGAFNPSFAPDGRAIAVDASWAGPRRIWLLDARGRNPVQATSDVSEAVAHLRPRFSPGGGAIVFQNLERTRFNVKAVDLVARRTVTVTNELWSDLNPVWSASGRHVFFSSFRSGGLNVWRIPVSETGEPRGPARQITNGAGQDVEIAVAPGGGRLAFTILKQNASLWTLAVETATGRAAGTPVRLVASSKDDSRGSFSPDGARIAFNSVRSGDMNVWLFERATGQARPVTRGPGGDYQPFWSPDGTRLAFFSSRNGSPGIWTVDLESGALACLSAGHGIEINPCFSPDGRNLAFQSDRDGRLEVWMMGADGGEPRQLTRCGVGGHFLRFTPDGRHVIFRCPSAGATLRVGVDGGEPEPMGTIAGGAHMSLSPDASRIMDVVAHKVLWVSRIGADAAEPVFEFEDPDVRIDYPVWSPDGETLLFDRFKPRGGEIWVLDGVA